jgi:hypothetical protein
MKNYKELKEIYKPVFLNYIISRSKTMARKLNTDYEDLTQEGLLKLVEMYSTGKEYTDPAIMIALVRKYNDILAAYENKLTFVPIYDLEV